MRRYGFEQFAAIRSYSGLTFSPDGEHVAYTTNTSGQFNVWRQPVHPSGDEGPLMPRQLTTLTDDVARTVAWSPDGTRIVTTVDHHGNENFQLCQVPAEDGWLYPITSNPDVRHEVSQRPFSPDGKKLAYASNERSPADFDVVVRDLETDETKTFVEGDGIFAPANWSPDGSKLLVLKLGSNTDQDLYVYGVASGDLQNMTPHEEDTIFFPGPWAADGGSFYIVTNQGREFAGLARVHLDRPGLEWVETPDWDVEDVELSEDGRWLAWLTNEDGTSKLQVRDLGTGARFPRPAPRGLLLDLSEPHRAIAGPVYITGSPAGGHLYRQHRNRRALDLDTELPRRHRRGRDGRADARSIHEL
jgi:dipeptidyl aminopeptidase/acylaminoacyl peptidase